jgi:hypothetical protein
MPKTYNNKTLEEYYALWKLAENSVSQTEFCKFHNIPRSTFNDYVRKKKGPNDIIRASGLVRREQIKAEREIMSLPWWERKKLLREFLSVSNDVDRTKTLLGQCSSIFFWKIVIFTLAFPLENFSPEDYEKIFGISASETELIDELEKTIQYIYFNYYKASLNISDPEREFELTSANIFRVENFLQKNKNIIVPLCFYLLKTMLEAINSTSFGEYKYGFPSTFGGNYVILKSAARTLLQGKIMDKKSIQEYADVLKCSYWNAFNLISAAENEVEIFGKIFPYDFVE